MPPASINILHLRVSKIKPEQEFKVKVTTARSNQDPTMRLQTPTNVPIKYQHTCTPYCFWDIARTRFPPCLLLDCFVLSVKRNKMSLFLVWFQHSPFFLQFENDLYVSITDGQSVQALILNVTQIEDEYLLFTFQSYFSRKTVSLLN